MKSQESDKYELFYLLEFLFYRRIKKLGLGNELSGCLSRAQDRVKKKGIHDFFIKMYVILDF